MKKFTKILFIALSAFVMAAFSGVAAETFELASFELAAPVSFVVSGAVGLISFIGGAGRQFTINALQTEVWVTDIMENLFSGMEFVSRSVDDSSEVNNKTVHIPQAGASPSIAKNRSSFPATIAERTDTDLTYNIDNYTTDPIRVRNFDEVQVSYAKRQSVMSEHIAALRENIGDNMAYNWAVSGNAARVLRTTGSNGTNLAPGATGTRKKVTKEDIFKLRTIMDNDKVPADGRVLLMPSSMYEELFGIDALIRHDYMQGASSLPDGVVTRLAGFDIMVRPTVVTFDNQSDPEKKAVGASTAATDNLACIAWSKYYVRHAVGSIMPYLNEGVAEHFGDIMSAEVNFGGVIGRTDLKGVASLVQAAGA